MNWVPEMKVIEKMEVAFKRKRSGSGR